MPNSLTQLLHKYRKHGATRFFAKELAPNDNSKNQIYLAGDFSVLNILPHSQIIEDTSKIASSIRDRSKAQLDFYWANDSSIIQAPNTKLIPVSSTYFDSLNSFFNYAKIIFLAKNATLN